MQNVSNVLFLLDSCYLYHKLLKLPRYSMQPGQAYFLCSCHLLNILRHYKLY